MPPTHCPTLFQNLWFNKLINNPPCVHRHKEGYRMSVHSHRYRGRFSGGRQMAPALSPSWLNFFPGDISASLGSSWLILRLFPSSCWPEKALLAVSMYTSSLVCLLWTPAAIIPFSLNSCTELQAAHLPLSLSKLSQLSPEDTLSIPPWQSDGIYYSHLQLADTPLTVSPHINKALVISSLLPHLLYRGQKWS